MVSKVFKPLMFYFILKVSVLERTPAGMSSMTDMDMMRDYQQSRLTIDRLENEKKELQHEVRMARQQAGVGNVSLFVVCTSQDYFFFYITPWFAMCEQVKFDSFKALDNKASMHVVSIRGQRSILMDLAGHLLHNVRLLVYSLIYFMKVLTPVC